MDDIIEQIKKTEIEAEENEITSTSIDDNNNAALFQTIVNYNMAALIGHEISHVFDNVCPIKTSARTEESGLFKKVVNEQQIGELFCPWFPAIEEVWADRCALRHIRHLRDKAKLNINADENKFEDFSRRVASDMIAFQSLVGWRRHKEIALGKYAQPFLQDYLYSPYRLLLMTAEIHEGISSPVVCGESASLFVQGVQESFRNGIPKRLLKSAPESTLNCSEGKGNVSDDLLALLPKGVESSWNGSPWTKESFSCGEIKK